MKTIFALFAITAPLAAFSAVPAQQPNSSAVTAPTVNNSPQVAAMSQVAPTPVADEASELAALQRRIPVLKAKAEIAKQEAEIAKAEAEKRNAVTPTPTAQAIGGMPSPSLTAGLPTTVSVHTPQALRTPNPVKPTESINVNAITSFNGRFAASLDVNGSDVPVRPGDQIEGGWTVGTITASTVAISKKNQSRLLRW